MKLTRLFAIALLGLTLSSAPLCAQETASPAVQGTATDEVGAHAPAASGQPDLDKASEPEHGKEKQGLPQMDVSTFPSQLFWLAVNFALLFLLMWQVALPRVTQTLHKRAVALKEALHAADTARERAQNLRDQSNALTFGASDEVKKVMDELNRSIQNEQQKRNKELTDLLEQKQTEAEQKIHALVESAEQAIPAEAASIAKSVIEKVAALKPSNEQVRQAVPPSPLELKGAA